MDLDNTKNSNSHPFGCNCFSCRPLTPTRFATPDWYTRHCTFAPPTSPFHLDIEMAGTRKESILVTLKGESLKIVWTTRLGELKTQTIPLGGKYYNIEQLSCSYQDGIFSVQVPLKKEKPPEPAEEPEITIKIQ